TVPVPIASIAIRVCPRLPPTTEERIADTRAANVADSVMYRQALATAAEARGWSVHWYDRERVFRDAAAALGGEDIDAFLHAMGRSIGPPWQAKPKNLSCPPWAWPWPWPAPPVPRIGARTTADRPRSRPRAERPMRPALQLRFSG